jgi:hypothetical protein
MVKVTDRGGGVGQLGMIINCDLHNIAYKRDSFYIIEISSIIMQNCKVLVAVILIIFLFAITNQLFERTLASQMVIGNQSNSSAVDEETRLGTQDLNNDDEYNDTQEMIANDLHDLSPEEIATYPLNELPPADLIMIFNSLSVDDLEKTLNNIRPDNLREILVVKLTQTKVDQILNRLPEYTVREILDRINPS